VRKNQDIIKYVYIILMLRDTRVEKGTAAQKAAAKK
jgi:hypothetical protein